MHTNSLTYGIKLQNQNAEYKNIVNVSYFFLFYLVLVIAVFFIMAIAIYSTLVRP